MSFARTPPKATVPPATKPATSKPVTPKPPGIETDLAEAAARPTFPAGIILALSFEADQWTKEADGTIVVKDTSGRAGDAPLTARTSRGTLGAGGKTGTGIAFPPGSRADLGIPAKATAGLKTFTFAFWVKTTESGKGKMYWTHPTLLGYRSNGGGSRDFGITSSRGHIGYWSGLDRKGDRDYQSAKIRINDGAWHHIALTNDGKALRLYVDARAVSPKPLPAGLALPTAQIPLGGSRSDPRDRYGPLSHSGTYDELQLYNRALTPTEIAAIAGLDRPSTREKRGPGKTKRRKRAKKKAQEKALRTPSGANTHTSPPSLISLVRKKRPGGSPRRARRARSLPGQKLLQENPPPPRPPRSLR